MFLVLFWGTSILNRWDFERTRVLSAITRQARMRWEIPAVPLWVSMNTALVLILTGQIPHWEPALYLTAVVVNLFLTAQLLLYLVYLQRSPRPAALGEPPADIEVDALAQDQETQLVTEAQQLH